MPLALKRGKSVQIYIQVRYALHKNTVSTDVWGAGEADAGHYRSDEDSTIHVTQNLGQKQMFVGLMDGLVKIKVVDRTIEITIQKLSDFLQSPVGIFHLWSMW